MRIIVFGSNGFLGRHIVPALTQAGHEVYSVGRSPSLDIVCNVVNGADLERVARDVNPDVAVNLLGAGISDPAVDSQMMELINARLPGLLLETLISVNPDIHLIHASSSTEQPAESGAFESEYSRTKEAGSKALELSARAPQSNVTILRIHNTYGEDQPANRFIASTIDTTLRGEPVVLRYPRRVRDFVHVDDVASSFVEVVRRSEGGLRQYEVGTGVGCSLEDVAGLVAGEVGVPYTPGVSEMPIDEHPTTVADLGSLLQPATITLPAGIARVVRDRREGGVSR